MKHERRTGESDRLLIIAGVDPQFSSNMNSRSFQNGACDIPAHLSASSASFVSGILNSDLARQVLSVPTTSSNSSSSTKDESTQHERTETSSLQQQHAVSSPQPPPVYTLPPDLPAPADDYACDHLRSGRFFVPSLCLEATSGKKVCGLSMISVVLTFFQPWNLRSISLN